MPPSADPGARREAGPHPPRGRGRSRRWLALLGAVSAILVGGVVMRTLDTLDPGSDGPPPPGPSRTSDPASCPELTLHPMPIEFRETARRRLVPELDVSPLRVDLQGLGEHRITILSGQAEEFGGEDLGLQRVTDRAARFVRTPAQTYALIWTVEGDPSCSGYTVVAAGFGRAEVERLLGSFVMLPPP